MNEWHFGPKLTTDGTAFRLWAPAARRVDLLLGQQRHPLASARHGWFEITIPDAKAGTCYRFRIDDEIDVPDPASAFQPDDVFGASEVIDHSSFQWCAKDWRGRPWTDT